MKVLKLTYDQHYLLKVILNIELKNSLKKCVSEDDKEYINDLLELIKIIEQ